MSETISTQVVNLHEKLRKFSEHWSPRVVAEVNDYQFKLAKFEGEFVWHSYEDTDEVFLVLAGSMGIEFRDGSTVRLGEGEMTVVPRGVEHNPFAEAECHVLLVEPRSAPNSACCLALQSCELRWRSTSSSNSTAALSLERPMRLFSAISGSRSSTLNEPMFIAISDEAPSRSS